MVCYLLVYGHPMEKDIKGDTSGVFKMLLVSLAQVQTFSEFAFHLIAEYGLKSFPMLLRLNLQGQRDEDQGVDVAKAKADAQRLFQAGKFNFNFWTFNYFPF